MIAFNLNILWSLCLETRVKSKWGNFLQLGNNVLKN